MTTRQKFILALLPALMLSAAPITAHPADENPELTLPENIRHYRQQRFGVFFHWGVSSVLCAGENVWKDRDIAAPDYERLAGFFNPARFQPDDYVNIAKTAGANYMVFSAKGPDGLALWKSRASDWNISRTPLGKDVVKEVVEAARRKEMKLYLSYSLTDWHLAWQAGSDDLSTTPAQALAKAQMDELMGDFGKIDGLRFEGWNGRGDGATLMAPIYHVVHDLQPSTLIGSNHGQDPWPEESYQVKTMADAWKQQFAEGEPLQYHKTPVELEGTVNQTRGYNITDTTYKTGRELVHNLVRAAGMDANYLVSVGIMPDGQVAPEAIKPLYEVGKWLARNSQSIMDTRGGPLAPQPWGVTTHRGRKIYVHVLDPEARAIEANVPDLRTARYLKDERDVEFDRVSSSTVRLKLRPENWDELERTVVLETKEYQELPAPLLR